MAVDVVVAEHETSNASMTGEEDLLAKSDCLTVLGRDHKGRKVLRLTGRSVPPLHRLSAESISKFFNQKLEEYLESDERFVMLYIHTGTEWQNTPTLFLTWSVYSAISAHYWSNLEYMSRIEFLDDFIPRKLLSSSPTLLPEFVHDYDKELEFQPLIEYGIYAPRQSDVPVQFVS